MTESYTFGQKIFLKALSVVGSTQGWTANEKTSINELMEQIVQRNGLRGGMRFMKTFRETLKLTDAAFGDIEGQFLVALAGMLNGCRFCGVGHCRLANVFLYEREGVFFPIDELSIPELQTLTDDELLKALNEALSADRWADLRRRITRVMELRSGSEAVSDEDHILDHLLRFWALTNDCTINIGFDMNPEDVPVLEPLTKDRAALRRYRAARDAELSKN